MSFHVFKTEAIRFKCLFLFQEVLKVLKVVILVVVKGTWPTYQTKLFKISNVGEHHSSNDNASYNQNYIIKL